MDKYEARLRAKVEAYNRAGEVANELFPQMHKIFKQFSGQKVCKVDGPLLKKVKDQLPESNYPDQFPSPTVMYYRNSSDYTINFTVKTCAQCGDGLGCVYAELTFYVCSIINGVVQEGYFHQPPEYRTDYNAEEIRRLRAVYQKKREEANEAQGALCPFGETDN